MKPRAVHSVGTPDRLGVLMLLALLPGIALADPLVAVVVIDQEARQEGYALELDELVIDDALPIDVGEGELVLLVDPQGERHALDVAPGEAWEITGRRGEAWMSKIGEEVRTDVIEVRGEADAVRALATSLGAEVREEGGHVWLVGDGILFDAPWAEDGADIDEVRFVQVDSEASTVTTTPRAVKAKPVAVVAPVVAAVGAHGGPPHENIAAGEIQGLSTDASAASILAALAPVEPAPAAPEPVKRAPIDPYDYVGLYLCGDGSMLLLSWTGDFSHSRAVGTWKVSAPGVVRLEVGGRVWGRAGIDVDTHHCRAVG